MQNCGKNYTHLFGSTNSFISSSGTPISFNISYYNLDDALEAALVFFALNSPSFNSFSGCASSFTGSSSISSTCGTTGGQPYFYNSASSFLAAPHIG